MKIWKVIALSGLLGLLSAVSASAQTTIGDAGPGVGAVSAGGAPPTGQTFTVPAGVSRLSSVKIGASSPGPFTIALHRWGGVGVGVNGPALATRTISSNPQAVGG